MKKTKFNPDTLGHIERSDLIQLSRELLDAVVRGTAILEVKDKEMTPEKLKESKVVLGYLNAADKTIKTKMQYFKMTGVQRKVDAIKQMSKIIK